MDERIEKLIANLPEEGQKKALEAFDSLSRALQANMSNYNGLFCSEKNGCTIGYESGTRELPFIFRLEHDPNVIAYREQAFKIKVPYIQVDGKHAAYDAYPDFIAFYKNKVEVIEVKSKSAFQKKCIDRPNKWNEISPGIYDSPPLRKAIENMGFSFRCWYPDEKSESVLTQNLKLIDSINKNPKNYTKTKWLEKQIKNNPGVQISSVLHEVESIDEIVYAISQGKIQCALENESLTDDNTRLWTHCIQVSTYVDSLKCNKASAPESIINYDINDTFGYGSEVYKIKLCSPTELVFENAKGSGQTMSTDTFSGLIEAGHIVLNRAASSEDPYLKFVQSAPPENWRIAKMRLDIIYSDDPNVSERTKRRYLESFQHAEASYGWGLLGLLPKFSERGNRKPRFNLVVRDTINEIIEQHYLQATSPTIKSCYLLLINSLELKGECDIPSYKTFCNIINDLKTKDKIKERKGQKAAYNHDLQNNTNLEHAFKALRPFESVYIDCTQVDLETTTVLPSGEHLNLGRPWLVIAFDEYSKCILGFLLTYSRPNSFETLSLLRLIAKKHARLPSNLILDRGKEFDNSVLKDTCALYRINTTKRPPAQSRYGSECERFFGILNTRVFHNLKGNNKLLKDPRSLSKSHHAKPRAIWNLEEIDKLIHDFIDKVYHQEIHSKLASTPQSYFENGIIKFGSLCGIKVIYSGELIVHFLPYPKSGITRVINKNGILVDGTYYWADLFAKNNLTLNGTKVTVKCDPLNINHVYALVKGKWVECKPSRPITNKPLTQKELLYIREKLIAKDSYVRGAKSKPSVQSIKFQACIKDKEQTLLSAKEEANKRVKKIKQKLSSQKSKPEVDPELIKKFQDERRKNAA